MMVGMARAPVSPKGLRLFIESSQPRSLGNSEDHAEFAVTEWPENWHHKPPGKDKVSKGRFV